MSCEKWQWGMLTVSLVSQCGRRPRRKCTCGTRGEVPAAPCSPPLPGLEELQPFPLLHMVVWFALIPFLFCLSGREMGRTSQGFSYLLPASCWASLFGVLSADHGGGCKGDWMAAGRDGTMSARQQGKMLMILKCRGTLGWEECQGTGTLCLSVSVQL